MTRVRLLQRVPALLYGITSLFLTLAMAGAAMADLNDNWSPTFGPPDLIGSEGDALGMFGSSLVIGGIFAQYENGANPPYVFAENVALWDGLGWKSAGARGLHGNGSVGIAAVVEFDGELYVGGTFTQTSSGVANYIAKFNGSSWVPVESGHDPDGPVKALAVFGGKLYAGGEFSAMGGLGTNGIARLSSTGHWENVGNLLAGGVVGPVYALAVSGSNLFVGGNFSSHDGTPFSNTSGYGNIGTYNGSSWSKVAEGVDGPVYALSASGSSDVYVGGAFLNVRSGSTNSASDRVAKTTSGTWTTYSSGGDLTTSGEFVQAVEVFDDTLYIGGTFTLPSGYNLAKRGSSAWIALPQSPGNSSNAVTAMLAVGDTNLVVTGAFNMTVDATTFHHIGRWTGTRWKTMGNGFRDDALGGNVDAITEDTGNLYVAGRFTAAGDVPANRVAKFDGTTWIALGSGIDETNAEVHDVAVFGGNVYVGGKFTATGSTTLNNIGKWNGSSWSALSGSSTGTNGGNGVNALIVYNDTLIVGGSFTSAGSVSSTSHCAGWSGSAWSAIGGGLPDEVVAFAVHEDTLYAATTGRSVYRRTSGAWSNIGTVSVNGTLYALGSYPGGLVAGGTFTTIGGTSADNVARWNGASWVSLGAGVSGGIVRGLTGIGLDLLAVGDFTDHAVRWNGSTWTALGSTPLDGKGLDAVSAGNDVYVVGEFWRAGGKPSVHIAAFQDITAPAAIADLEVSSVGRHSEAISWTWSGDDGAVGTADSYELRYRVNASLTSANFASAGTLVASGTPGSGGTTECTEIDDLDDCTTYYWAIKMTDDADNVSYSNSPSGMTKCTGTLIATCGGDRPQSSLTGVRELQFELSAGYPNPRNGMYRIQYSSTGKAPVSIRVFDIAGRLVKTLVSDDRRTGNFVVTWDGRDEHGVGCHPGVYLYRMDAGAWRSQRKVVFLER